MSASKRISGRRGSVFIECAGGRKCRGEKGRWEDKATGRRGDTMTGRRGARGGRGSACSGAREMDVAGREGGRGIRRKEESRRLSRHEEGRTKIHPEALHLF